MNGGTPYMLFLWSVPISCVILIIFNSIWGKRDWLFWIVSVLLWTILACVHIQLIEYNNFWIIYFIGIPLQVAVILWGALMKNPNGKHQKAKKEKQKKDSTTKENIPTQAETEKVEKSNSDAATNNVLHKDL